MEKIVHGKFPSYDYNLKIASKSNCKSWSKERTTYRRSWFRKKKCSNLIY